MGLRGKEGKEGGRGGGGEGEGGGSATAADGWFLLPTGRLLADPSGDHGNFERIVYYVQSKCRKVRADAGLFHCLFFLCDDGDVRRPNSYFPALQKMLSVLLPILLRRVTD